MVRAGLVERQRRAAQTDGLTGAANRRAFDEALLRGSARAARGQDVVARYGGEQFAVILPGLPAEQALEVVEAADRALYRAKRTGRDRSVAADDPALAGAGVGPTD